MIRKIVGAALIAMMATSGTAIAAKKIIKLGHYMSDTHPQHIALKEYFKKTIEDETQGRYEIRIYPNNQIGGEDQVLNGIRNGTIEMGITGLLLQNVNPVFGVWEWPFLFKNNAEARKVLTDSQIAKDIMDKHAEYGIKVLAIGMNGFRVVSSNKPVNNFAEFNGLRLRVPMNNMFVVWAKAMTINPQSMPLSEVFTALEQHVIDGQENPYALIKESGLYEVQKYIIETNHSFSPGLLQISLKTWKNIPEEDQKIFIKAAQNYQQHEWDLAIKAEGEVKTFLKGHDIKIIEPDDQFKADMLKAVQPMYQEYFNKYDWAQKTVEAINAAK
ncbi:TRAP transporter substrate-binding protein [Klebsiella grimontii]|uniref:TRAP transporter substrate-binding protein n=1 Tax=Klebsiella grimontii TaxID=2058152 RepID=UPI0007CCDAC4|nr:TRAP transporter substrate-binding protein [Klebsiella grimontii]MDU4310841.1 TRAP transporter substrate-binding protein [Klebsiella michiganensis]GJK44721.1 hypothetical protein TUM17559_28640 [Enterobacter cloacae]GJL13917.1 hypothetical protein TUM17572_37240 [Klebsiella oxytoca]MBZ7137657.1 TRAP transporter substrate-binding protein [Klebsiella grimontii]MDU4228440.1 TRAP transporter substrate-binding protein [Klebsiella grimontii]